MEERPGAVTFKGNPLTLLGPGLKVGDAGPDCTLLGSDLSEVKLSGFAGRARLIASVPSLDTPVCDTETRRFNQLAAGVAPGVAVLTVSMDLPFAQKRWCGAAGIDRVVTLSDHRGAAFGCGYGVLIKELRLLARAVFVVDADDAIRYVELVTEITAEPDYDAALEALKRASS